MCLVEDNTIDHTCRIALDRASLCPIMHAGLRDLSASVFGHESLLGLVSSVPLCVPFCYDNESYNIVEDIKEFDWYLFDIHVIRTLFGALKFSVSTNGGVNKCGIDLITKSH